MIVRIRLEELHQDNSSEELSFITISDLNIYKIDPMKAHENQLLQLALRVLVQSARERSLALIDR